MEIDLKKFIIENMLCSDGIKINAKKSESWLKVNHPSILEEINKICVGINLFKNKIYMIINNDAKLTCNTCKTNNFNENKIRYNKFICDDCFNKDVRNRTEETNLKKYGCKTPVENSIIKEKIKNTNLEKYGVEYVLKNDAIRKKIKETNVVKYGYNVASKNHIVRDKVSKSKKNTNKNKRSENGIYYTQNINEAYDIYLKENMSMTKIAEICDINVTTLTRMFQENNLKMYKKSVSGGESDMFAYLKETYSNFEIIHSDRKSIYPKEIDIYIPKLKLGIEYNGWYWHSTTDTKIDTRHKEKRMLCEEKNIQLMQFWDHEVELKPHIVYSMINSKFGNNKKIFARKCILKEISNEIYKNFCNENHLQGYGVAKYRYGLYHDNVLVSVMSFSKSRFDKSCDFEMVRFCNKINFNVVGGASKLFKNFIKNNKNKSIVSYADARISNGNLYCNLGFTFKHHSQPNYYYVKEFGNFESRIKYQKHKIKTLLGNFDESLTEKENMIKNGYRIIYDAGNLVFYYNKSCE